MPVMLYAGATLERKTYTNSANVKVLHMKQLIQKIFAFARRRFNEWAI